LVWNAGNLEEIGLHPCSVGHFAHRGRKREAGSLGETSGWGGVCPSATVVAGSWLTPEKKARKEQEITLHNQMEGAELKITAGDLARTLVANGLMLIGDGERFKVIKS
jgi:hypothetical protein